MTNEEMIQSAERILKPHKTTDGRLVGDVAATIVTDAGHPYFGVAIDTSSGTGFCAEHAAREPDCLLTLQSNGRAAIHPRAADFRR